MKPIELTEEHKAKLLEMCKVLYPEYGEVQLLKSYCATKYDATGSPYLRWYIPFKHKDKETTKLIEIHWFEFCRYYIFVEINKRSKRSWKETSLEFMNCKHPITYLYEQFKKLK